VTFTVDPAILVAFSLALVRASAWLFVSPPFNTRMIPTVVKVGIAASLAICAAPHIAVPDAVTLDTSGFIIALVSQAFVGFALGLLSLVLVNAVQTAGALVDLFAGYSLAAIIDPINNAQVAVFGRFYELLAITLLFTTNAYLILVNGWFRSFKVIPARGLNISDVSKVLTAHLGEFFTAAIEIAGPILACLFLAEVLIGILSRAAPQLNVFSLAFPIRVVVALVVVALALPLVAPALANLVHDAVAPLGTA